MKRIRKSFDGPLKAKVALEAIYPQPRLSQGEEKAKKYPYLLRGLKIEEPNQVWYTSYFGTALQNIFNETGSLIHENE